MRPFGERRFRCLSPGQQERKLALVLRALERTLHGDADPDLPGAGTTLSFPTGSDLPPARAGQAVGPPEPQPLPLAELIATARSYLDWLDPQAPLAAARPALAGALVALSSAAPADRDAARAFCEASNALVWQALERHGLSPRDEQFYQQVPDHGRARAPLGRLVPLLVDLRSPHNVGAIMRSAEFFGCTRLALLGGTVDLASPRLTRVSRGCERQLVVTRHQALDELLATFQAAVGCGGEPRGASGTAAGEMATMSPPVVLWGVETTSAAEDIAWLDPPPAGTLLVAFGNEEYGLPRAVLERCERLIAIPGRGRKASLNVAAAAAVVLHQLGRRLVV